MENGSAEILALGKRSIRRFGAKGLAVFCMDSSVAKQVEIWSEILFWKCFYYVVFVEHSARSP